MKSVGLWGKIPNRYHSIIFGEIMMSWRWFKYFKLPGGIRANASQNGVGYSFGFRIVRFGTSATGKRWVSIRIPIVGVRLFRYLSSKPTIRRSSNEHPYSSMNDDLDSNQTKEISWKNIK
ncbi:DUF4236 domain-containing protein [Vibrio lentus]|uniref:DUF4236 domain-containing protein n=1 Tax=Vibrio lentus TaxID=136468 RepID=UPI000D0A99B1